MEFLVEIQVICASAAERHDVERLIPDERAVGRELVDRGHIVRIWRIPGSFANVGIWSAEDATQLHDVLRSLPLFPWSKIRVTPLAVHELEAPSDRGT